MKELIKYIAKALVDLPEQVDVAEVEGTRLRYWNLKWPKRILERL